MIAIKEDNHLREIDDNNIDETIKDMKFMNKYSLLNILNNSGLDLTIKDIDFILGKYNF